MPKTHAPAVSLVFLLTIFTARLEAGTFQISPTVIVPGATNYSIPAINNEGAVAFTAGNSNGGTVSIRCRAII